METLSKTPAVVGQRFSVYNGDAKGTIESVNTQEVTYRYDHELETLHTHSRLWLDANTYPVVK